jgi:DNA-binding phage protein
VAIARSAVALATELHSPDGNRRGDEEAARLLRAAALAFGARAPWAVAGASSLTAASVLVLPLTSPETLLDAVLALAASLRAHRPTFCGSVAESARGDDAGLLAQTAAADRAVAGLSSTDARGPRAVMLAPEEDATLGALVDLILTAHDAMTARQRQVVALVRESRSQQAVAKHLGVSRQAVNQSLASAGWPILSHAEGVARERLGGSPAGAPRARRVHIAES